MEELKEKYKDGNCDSGRKVINRRGDIEWQNIFYIYQIIMLGNL